MEILCFGDSHARYFRKSNMLSWSGVVGQSAPSVMAFDYVAASAKGFAAGPRSRFAYNKFARDFQAHQPEHICLAYGQVDAEVGHYFRRYAAGSQDSVEADLTNVYRSYVAMATQVLDGRKPVFKGPNPSTMRLQQQLLNYAYRRVVARITDPVERDRIWQLINETPPTVAEHARINQMAAEILSAEARRAGCSYFDVRETLEDKSSPGLAQWDFVCADSDVHVSDCFTVRRAYAEGLFSAFGQSGNGGKV